MDRLVGRYIKYHSFSTGQAGRRGPSRRTGKWAGILSTIVTLLARLAGEDPLDGQVSGPVY